MAAHCTQCGEALAADARFCPACGTPAVSVVATVQDPLLGQVVADRYLVQDKIGQGRSGSIYRAEHTTLHRKMAVKVLHHALSRDEAAIDRFRREATTIAQIENDHLLQIFDFGRTTDQRLFFAMELLEGETLDAALERQQRLEPERAAKILRQLAEALREAHEQGYIHRDLRPRNVFLSVRRGERDFVKLLDFGLAKLVLPDADSTQTALGMTFGDARYMSPEQARGDTIDKRSDVYSIGIVGYQMLTGQVPFTGNGPFEILQKALSTEAPRVRALRPDCPPWLDAVLARCLKRNRTERFADMTELLVAMERRKEPRPEPTPAPDEEITKPEPIAPPLERPKSRVGAAEPVEREQTNPGWKQARPGGVREPALADSVSGEVTTIPREAKDESHGPSIVIDSSIETEHGESTGRQSPAALQAARTAPAEASLPDLPMQGEPSGPQEAWFDAGADAELEPAKARGRGPVFIAGVAGAFAILATIALWPHGKPRVDTVAQPAVPPPAPVVTQLRPQPVAEPPQATKPATPKPVAHTAPLPAPVAKAKPVAATHEPAHEAPREPARPATKPEPPLPRGFTDPFAGEAKKSAQADALIKSGRQKIASGDTTQAQTAFAQARAIDPHNADAVAGLGEVSFESGDYGNAVAMLRQALRLSPNRARYLILLGESYYKMGKAKDAVTAYRQALTLDPANQEAQRSLELAQKKLNGG